MQPRERRAPTGSGSLRARWPGDPAEALIAVAEDHDANLLVVGNRGMSRASRFPPGQRAHHAPCNVLIVRTD
jgi:nucleotide-binding universal stress UspA family protein